MFDFVKPALIGEADRAAEIHKNIYDKLMSSKGPYQNILKSVSKNFALSLSLRGNLFHCIINNMRFKELKSVIVIPFINSL